MVTRHVALLLICAHGARATHSGDCSQSQCRSPSSRFGWSDCWAGTLTEPCSCSQGLAVVIGNRTQGNRLIYEYTCCTVIRDADAGPNCGDYDEGYWIIDIVSRLLIPVVALSAAFSFAHYVRNRNARARELRDRRQHRH